VERFFEGLEQSRKSGPEREELKQLAVGNQQLALGS
jgi:hypothetical protein